MKSSLKIIDENLLAELYQRAESNHRLRQNHNIHENLDDRSQRLLNAMAPGSYIRPHRHLLTPKPELFWAIAGRLALLVFSDTGAIEAAYILEPAGPVRAIEVPAGLWHTVVSMEKGSIFLEVKAGPYVPVAASDLAPWAPEPESQEAVVYLERLVHALGDYK
jgi:cupin fold WbuC family metalloprotein